MRVLRGSLSFLFALLVCSSILFAQSDRGTITGTVMDASGAVVPDAKVTATSQETGEVRTAVTSGSGAYTIPNVKAETWNIQAEAAGFTTAKVDGVKVAVQVTRTVDFNLNVAGGTEQVTVSGEAPVLQAESPANQTNVSERQVKELPLLVGAETGGRTPLAFIFLDSNVTAAGGSGTNASNFRINGGQGLGNEILIDGAATRRAQNGTFFSEVAPGPNAFQEFTVSTSSYSAEYGNSTGGVVNFTLKSGGSQFHGEAYELFRNEALNANSFLNKNNPTPLPRNRDRQHNFGANLGGPIPFFPANRAFFFGNYEGYRFSQSESVFITVPTVRMRSGDFSELLTDSYVTQFFGGPVQLFDNTQPVGARTAIPGNRLDTYNGGALINPIGRALLQRFPEPTEAGVYHNYLAQSTTPTDMNNYVGKLDFVLTDRQRLAGSYSYRKVASVKGCCGNAGFVRFPEPDVASGAWDQTFRSHFARLQHDYTLSNTLLNHFNAGWTRFEVANRNFTEGMQATDFGFAAEDTQNKAWPLMGFPGYGDMVTSADPRAYHGIGSTFFSDQLGDNAVQFSNTVTWVRGGHTFKFGGDWRIQQFNVHQLIHPGGEFNFRHPQTANGCCPDNEGWPIASLITGAPEFSFNSIQSIDPGWRQFSHSYFINDDWKITPRLTVNLGLRYDLPGLRTEAQDRFRGFDPAAINPVTGRPGALIGAGGQSGLQAEHSSLTPPDRSNWGPRVGFAYSLAPETVIRGGIGLYYAPILYGFGGSNTLTEGTLGYSAEGLVIQGGADTGVRLTNYPNVPTLDPDGQFINFGNIDYFDQDFRTGRTVQYTLDVQQQLPWNLALQVGYIGHKGTRLRSDYGRLNALPLDALKLGAPLLNKPLANVTAADRAYASSVGVTLPASTAAVYAGFNGSVAQSLRPFPHYNFIRNQLESRGQSWYNAMNVRLDRRFSNGLQFGAYYTWGKLISNASEDLFGGSPVGGVVQNPYDLTSLRSVSPGSVAHSLAINYIIELPFGRGQRWAREGIANALFGGWQFTGVHRYQGGTPLVIRTEANRSNDFLELFGVRGNRRPNIVSNPQRTTNSPSGANYRYLNQAAFVSPTNYFGPFGEADVGSAAYAAYYADPSVFFGNARPTIDVRGPGFFSEDMSIMKKSRLTERLTLELRGEFFNVFNRHRYFFSDNDAGNAGIFGNASIDQGYQPRRIQLGVRVIF